MNKAAVEIGTRGEKKPLEANAKCLLFQHLFKAENTT